MKLRQVVKARDEGIITLRVFVTPKERDIIQQKCKDNGFTMAHALRVLGLEWAESNHLEDEKKQAS
jgi:hypothetical protein